MAPNVKDITFAIQQLDLAQHVLPKYQPLTYMLDREQEQSEEVEAKSQRWQEEKESENVADRADTSVGDYWTWEEQSREDEKAKLIAAIVRADEARQATSCNAIILDLQSQGNVESSECMAAQLTAAAEECYWDMAEEVCDDCDRGIIIAEHVEDESHPMRSYWDWPSRKSTEERRQATIAAIMEAEAARESVSVVRIEALMAQGVVACGSQVCRADSIDNAAYWTWHSRECDTFVSESEQRQAVIEAILRKEAARESVSLSTLERGLQEGGYRNTVNAAVSCGNGNDASYWSW